MVSPLGTGGGAGGVDVGARESRRRRAENDAWVNGESVNPAFAPNPVVSDVMARVGQIGAQPRAAAAAPKKTGFFGGLFNGLKKIGKGIVDIVTFKDPKKSLMAIGLIAASIAFPPVGMALAAVGVLQGGMQMVKGASSGDWGHVGEGLVMGGVSALGLKGTRHAFAGRRVANNVNAVPTPSLLQRVSGGAFGKPKPPATGSAPAATGGAASGGVSGAGTRLVRVSDDVVGSSSTAVVPYRPLGLADDAAGSLIVRPKPAGLADDAAGGALGAADDAAGASSRFWDSRWNPTTGAPGATPSPLLGRFGKKVPSFGDTGKVAALRTRVSGWGSRFRETSSGQKVHQSWRWYSADTLPAGVVREGGNVMNTGFFATGGYVG